MMKKGVWLLWWLFMSFSLLASPTANVNLVGQGSMSWLFFELYQARLYSVDGQYQADRFPQVLVLNYQRDIDKEDLLDATVTEWQRLGVDWKWQWRRELNAMWPSVSKRDELALRVEPSGVSRFYFNRQLLGEIKDPAFGPAFLAIWLSPNSRNPSLTRQLKGN
ncbi:chalcone isomerase family protein [Oceanisphaera sp.]|uniref:chalcone isomerase family protein n=1 Tax=Oceanisphaera sp. TaxID=1929979 RepID=UPI003A913A3E